MSKKVFDAGQDLIVAMEASCNRRGAYDIDCSFCEHGEDEKYCEDCTIADTDYCCSCHINPPCSYCVGSKFEVTPYLVNYKHHKNGRKRWQCFKANKETFDKLEAIEDAGFHLSAEILTTGVAAMYISSNLDEPDLEVAVCPRREFKRVMCEMILKFNIKEGLELAEEMRKEDNGRND